jgi:hypothetical protein
MSLRFAGNFDELKLKLTSLESNGSWTKVNENQEQFRHNDGGILNWYPTTESTLLKPGDLNSPFSKPKPTPAYGVNFELFLKSK